MDDSYVYLLGEIKKIVKDSFEVFINRYDLEMDLFKHLWDVQVVFKETNTKNIFAEYWQDDNIIVISQYYINSLLKDVDDDFIDYQSFLNNVVLTYLHEIIHANRNYTN